jgi:phosphate transport system protein
MTKHLKRDLEGLERRLLLLAGQVEETFRRSIAALLERRVDLARRVVDGDRQIDLWEVEIEEECLKALALHQPVATDLRFIAACLKINNDLERIADLAVNIAERALSLSSRQENVAVPARFHDFMDSAARMLRESIDAFVRGDARLARAVCAKDEGIDQTNREIIADLLRLMHEDPRSIDQALELVSVSKNIERIADHATNIAEDVVYLVEGDIVRHRLEVVR